MPSLSATFSPSLIVAGDGWSSEEVRFTINGEELTELRAVIGTISPGGVQPANGAFQVEAGFSGSFSGSVQIEARERGGEQRAVTVAIEIPPAAFHPNKPRDDPRGRLEHFDRKRGRDREPNVSRLQVVNDVKAARATGIQPLIAPGAGANWSPIGPASIFNGQTLATDPIPKIPNRNPDERAPVSGRVTSIALDPIDPNNTIYIGTAQGGVWKTTDGGVNWIPKSDFEVSLAIGAIATVQIMVGGMAVTRIYAGTGEDNQSGDSYYGAGILRSDNGGDRWESFGQSDFQRAHIARIAVVPGNPEHLFVASDKGLAESTNAGVGWDWPVSDAATDIVVQGTEGNLVLIAGLADGTIGRKVGTAAWVFSNPAGTASTLVRTTLAVAPSQSSTIYAAFGQNLPGPGADPLAKIMKSPDGGVTWQKVTIPPGTDQSDYNLALAVDPARPDTVYLGEVNFWSSTNGGTNWTDVSVGTNPDANVALHADQHAIVINPGNGEIWVGNDGGIWVSTDACANWDSLNIGIQITQYTGIDAVGAAVILAGTQDNGWQGGFGNPAAKLLGMGDGGYAYIGRGPPTPWFVTQSSGNILGVLWSDDMGVTWNDPVITGLPATSAENYSFYPPFGVHFSREYLAYPGPLYYCGQHVWSQPAIGQPWVAISGDLTNAVPKAYITAIRVIVPGHLLVGTSNGLAWYLSLGSNGTWQQQQLTGLPGDPINQISEYVTPNSGGLVMYWVTGGFSRPHVWSWDFGTKAFTSLPNPGPLTDPVLSVATHRPTGDRSVGTVFVGCDVGIYRSDDFGQTWREWDAGLPNVAVVDLKWVEDGSNGGVLIAATHGRGIWERPVDLQQPAPPTPAVELYLRHSDGDNGFLFYPYGPNFPVPPIPEPTLPVANGDALNQALLLSPDVKIDTPDFKHGARVYQFPNAQIDFAQFAELEDRAPRPGRTMRVYVQVRNRGYRTAGTVTARVYLCNSRGQPDALMALPTDFWTAFPTNNFAQSAFWSAIAPAQQLSNLRQGVPQILEFDWVVPANYSGMHEQFLFVAVTSAQDPIAETSLLPSQFVPQNKRTVVKPVDFPP
jgi:hypothetical protein